MRKLFLLLGTAGAIFAHSQVPITFGGEKNKLDSISLTQIKLVPISVQNLNNYKQKYSISVNNKVIGTTSFIAKNELKNIKVPVTIDKANDLALYKICTTSIPTNNKEMFNTKICTKAYLYWAKDK
jgi:hypothetical protein